MRTLLICFFLLLFGVGCISKESRSITDAEARHCAAAAVNAHTKGKKYSDGAGKFREFPVIAAADWKEVAFVRGQWILALYPEFGRGGPMASVRMNKDGSHPVVECNYPIEG
jgi:hypothetical protein